LEKPARLKATARFFPDKESEASTVSHITNEGHISDPLSYCLYKGREDLFTRISNKGINPYGSRIKILEKVSEAP